MTESPKVEVRIARADPTERRWSFASAMLDESSLELHVGGQLVSLERKPLEVLIHLLHHAGEVVTKDELAEALWPGRIVSETVVAKAVGKLRQALGDEAQAIIITVHGYGYRLVAPVKVEASAAKPPPRFDFKAGDHPRLRPLWSLVERLGTGGHGEAWLARHDKTRDARVFKFAADAGTLVSLKREITIYRLLHDALGERPDLVHLLDWNLEEAPYFIESEYIESGSLVRWAETQGGLSNVPLPTRLDIAAQIAKALAAAHSVGVLHKDLKPSNVLIESSPLPLPPPTGGGGNIASPTGRGRADGAGGGIPRIKLADFGSGGVLDPHRLEAMGITRLGFTKTVAAPATTSGTPLYIAPEVVDGQPFTVQADIYSLGVMLYQLIVGDLHKSLSPGWEKNVEDEILREDIAAAAEGNPFQRLADASMLAQRLRTLDERRRKRAAEKAAHVQAERQRLAMERMKARRVWIAATVVVLIGGLAASLWLYFDARQARDTALAVSRFLTQDVFSVANPFQAKTKDVTVKAMIDAAAKVVDERLAHKPEAAAQVLFALGMTYSVLGEEELQATHIRQAADILKTLYGDHDIRTLLVRSLDYSPTTSPEQRLVMLREIRAELERELGPFHPQVFENRIGQTWARLWTRQISQNEAIEEMRTTLADAQRALDRGAPGPSSLPNASWVLFLDPIGNDLESLIRNRLQGLSYLLRRAGRYQEGFEVNDRALALAVRKFGEHDFQTARLRLIRGIALSEMGRLEEAEVDMRGGLEDMGKWLGDDHNLFLDAQTRLGNMLLLAGRFSEAEEIYRSIVLKMTSGADTESDTATGVRLQHATALMWLGRWDESESQIQKATAIFHRKAQENREWIIEAQSTMGLLRYEQGRLTDATTIFEGLLADCVKEHCDPGGKISITFAHAKAKHRMGDLDQAEVLYREVASYYEKENSPESLAVASAQIELADVLQDRGKLQDAWALVNGFKAGLPQGPGAKSFMLADLNRVKGLLWLQEKSYKDARIALIEALQLYEHYYGPKNWRTKRTQEELARVPK